MKEKSEAAEARMPWYSELHTDPFWRWVNSWAELLFFEEFVVRLAQRADDVVKTAAEALLNYGPPKYQERKEQLTRQADVGGGVVLTYQVRHARLLAEMLHCRIVDSFLTYISELLCLVFRERPETMKSQEHIRLEVVLEHATMEELIGSLADRKVNELSYRGMRDLHRFLKDQLGFDLFPNTQELTMAVEAIERRNLIVHNRGIVTTAAVSRVPDLHQLLNKPLDSSTSTNSRFGMFFEIAVQSIDNGAAVKFKLPTRRMDAAQPDSRS